MTGTPLQKYISSTRVSLCPLFNSFLAGSLIFPQPVPPYFPPPHRFLCPTKLSKLSLRLVETESHRATQTLHTGPRRPCHTAFGTPVEHSAHGQYSEGSRSYVIRVPCIVLGDREFVWALVLIPLFAPPSILFCSVISTIPVARVEMIFRACLRLLRSMHIPSFLQKLNFSRSGTFCRNDSINGSAMRWERLER